MRIGLVTAAKLPLLSEDDQLLQAALRARGHVADALVWTDPAVDWAGYDQVVVRSCWDYHQRPAEFVAWVDRLARLGVSLWNPAPLLRWNHEKRYLLDLAARGVPIVPTVYLAAGETADLTDVLAAQRWSDAVVKPAIAATAFHTWRTGAATAAADQARFAALLAERALLVQPLMPQIQAGEFSVIFFGGAYSHTVLKRPAAGDFRSQDDFGGSAGRVEAAPTVIDQAAQVLRALEAPWLYARVDGLLVDRTFTLMELELIEPGLFLGLVPGAAERFAVAIERLA